MARIKHPRFQPGRSRGLAGIEFIDGYAEVDLTGNDILRQALVQHSYGIEEAAPAVRPAKASKRSGKGKPAKAGKISEPKGGAPAEPASGFPVAELSDGPIIGDPRQFPTAPVSNYPPRPLLKNKIG